MDIHRHYLGWEKPFTLAFADCLKAAGGNQLELDHWMVWVPSTRAGRQILSQLFSSEPSDTEAFHPPDLLTPAHFVRSLKGGLPDAASEAQCLHAWKTALEQAKPDQLAPVYPVLPSASLREWAFTAARRLIQVRSRLVEDEWDFRGVAKARLPHDSTRWQVLGDLETAYLRILASQSLRDPDSALADELENLLQDLPFNRLAIAGVLNLSKREARCMEILRGYGVQVDIYNPIPEDRAADLDPWGRPQPEVWDREPIPEAVLEGVLQRSPDPRELVGAILELAESCTDTDALAVGCGEADLSRILIERSRLGGSPFYSPEGRSLKETVWGRLIGLLNDWEQSGELSVLTDLLDHSLFREWTIAMGESPESLQSAILELRTERVFTNRDQLFDPALGPSGAVGLIRAYLARLDEDGITRPNESRYPDSVWHVLQTLAAGIRLDPESRTILERFEELLQDLKADFSGNVPRADFPELLDFEMSRCSHYEERGADERPVSGWLELPWETASHLVVLGLPDNQIPGTGHIDAFLTPSLCRTLGLYGQDEEAAFHGFRLRLLLESRRTFGKLDLLLPDRGLDDSPQLPSRFLFLAGEAHLHDRVQGLLGEIPSSQDVLPAAFGTSLRLPEPRPLEGIAVTAFRAYLANPFQFLLERRLGWSAPEPLPREMDPLQFGTLAHAVLERLNGSETGASLRDADPIREFMDAALDELAARRFGTELAVPLRIQLSSLRQRLSAAAPIIATERQAGWVPRKVEWQFHEELDFRINGIPLRGVIDLLEQNSGTGAYRIVDYKTSDTANKIRSSHLMYPNARTAAPHLPESEFLDGEKTARWKDLQLPLYQRAVEIATGERATCAYFNLAKAVGDTGIDQWTPDPAASKAALSCAEAIVDQIQSASYPLPAKSPFNDPWLSWFGGDYASTIDSSLLEPHPEGGE